MRLSENPPRRPAHPVTRAGVGLFIIGCIAALWLADWRWLLTGFVLMVGAALVAPGPKDQP